MRIRAVAVPAVLALALAGCGGSGGRHGGHGHHPHPRVPSVLDVYASLPWHTAAGESMLEGIRLADSQAGRRAGRYRITLQVLDSGRDPGRGQPPAAALDARQAATDPRAILFLGGSSDAATELATPILNLATLPELSTESTYVGLTQRLPPITGALEPGRYYPTGTRTLLRLLPDDAVQAAADLQVLALRRCARVAVAHDGSQYGRELAGLLGLERSGSSMTLLGPVLLRPSPAALRAYTATTLRGLAAPECFAYFGQSPSAAVAVVRAVHLALPSAPILLPDRLCTAGVSDPASGGVPAIDDPLLACTSAKLPIGAYPGGPAFAAAYRAAYRGARPGAESILGYEAMKLGLDTIARLGGQGDDRGDLVRALRGMTVRRSALGAYRFDLDGDTTLRSIGLFEVDPLNHRFHLRRVLTPTHVL